MLKKRTRRKDVQQELEQPDEFMQRGTTVVDWLLERGRLIVGAVGVVFAVLLVVSVLQGVQSRGESAAAEALFDARHELPEISPFGLDAGDSSGDDAKEAAALLKYEAMIAAHGGTNQADIARVEAASLRFRSGEYEAALALYEAARGASGIVGHQAQLGKAWSLEALGRNDDAIVALELLRARSVGSAKEDVLLSMGRIHEAAGDSAAAQGIYAAFEAEFPDSLRLPEVQGRITALAGK